MDVGWRSIELEKRKTSNVSDPNEMRNARYVICLEIEIRYLVDGMFFGCCIGCMFHYTGHIAT